MKYRRVKITPNPLNVSKTINLPSNLLNARQSVSIPEE
jgi:hypothetical protein